MKLISIAVPCFNEEEIISAFYNILSKVIKNEMKDLKFEIIFIDDGSSDNTLNVIKELSKKDNRVKYISFSRNFGKEAAIYAGLKNSSGDCVITMDVDLQDPPSLIPTMISYINEGYDCVATKRSSRKGEPILRSFFSNAFYNIINKLSETKIVNGARDYRVMKRPMIDSILEMEEYNRFSKGIFTWVGFETKWIEYNNIERPIGKSKWSFFKLLKYSFEGITSFSTTLLHFATVFGLIIAIISLILIVLVMLRTLIFGDSVAGWTSTISAILFIGGVQLFCIGLLGQYISKIYLETKNRPIYITKETNIFF